MLHTSETGKHKVRQEHHAPSCRPYMHIIYILLFKVNIQYYFQGIA